MKRRLLLYFLILTPVFLFSQRDTTFWFVAPEITKGEFSYDSPAVFRFSTYNEPAVITVSQPANPSFPIQVINIGAETSAVLDLTPYIEIIENKPPNVVLNKGILIEATSFITAYYEVIGEFITNPEIYALKGKNALGTDFYIPLQNLMRNSDVHFPLPHAAFDIVATEDNTVVSITPTKPIIGHAAGVTFNITLNKGQTYSAEALYQEADQHPTGSHVTSNKPVAITIKDDLLIGSPFFEGFCRDQVGDQIIPIDQTGTQYVVQKGDLNSDEQVLVVATQPNTQVFRDGVLINTLNTGGSVMFTIGSGSHFVRTTKPAYLLQISGTGCEVAGEIMPSLDCGGSQAVRFVRTSTDWFLLMVITQTGNEDAFKINGNPNKLVASDFEQVPGSNGVFSAATKVFSSGEITPGTSTLVENSSGLFHVGFVNGNNQQGAKFGFFSDFLNKTTVRDTVAFCEGDTLYMHGITIAQAGDYTTSVDYLLGCDTIFEIHAKTQPFISDLLTLTYCIGGTVSYNGITYSAPTFFTDTITSSSEFCDTIRLVSITPNILPTTIRDTVAFCNGDTLHIHGISIMQAGDYTATVDYLMDCDTIFEIHAQIQPFISDLLTLNYCPGSTISYNGISYSAPTFFTDTIPSSDVFCDTIRLISILPSPLPTTSRTFSFCPGDTLSIAGQLFSQPLTIIDTVPAITGCDTVRTTIFKWSDLPQVVREVYVCPGDSIYIGGKWYWEGATVKDTIFYPEQCDTVNIIHILNYTTSFTPFLPENAVLCPGNPLVFNSPYFSTLWNNETSGPVYTAQQVGWLTAEVADEHGCRYRDTVEIRYCCNESTIYAPNSFTPESDPPNDLFKVFSKGTCDTHLLRIYDRWGALLFESLNPSDGWDGTFRGKNCESGVYVWTLETNQSGQPKKVILKGDVTLIR